MIKYILIPDFDKYHAIGYRSDITLGDKPKDVIPDTANVSIDDMRISISDHFNYDYLRKLHIDDDDYVTQLNARYPNETFTSTICMSRVDTYPGVNAWLCYAYTIDKPKYAKNTDCEVAKCKGWHNTALCIADESNKCYNYYMIAFRLRHLDLVCDTVSNDEFYTIWSIITHGTCSQIRSIDAPVIKNNAAFIGDTKIKYYWIQTASGRYSTYESVYFNDMSKFTIKYRKITIFDMVDTQACDALSYNAYEEFMKHSGFVLVIENEYLSECAEIVRVTVGSKTGEHALFMYDFNAIKEGQLSKKKDIEKKYQSLIKMDFDKFTPAIAIFYPLIEKCRGIITNYLIGSPKISNDINYKYYIHEMLDGKPVQIPATAMKKYAIHNDNICNVVAKDEILVYDMHLMFEYTIKYHKNNTAAMNKIKQLIKVYCPNDKTLTEE
jgi:hypothetical protein